MAYGSVVFDLDGTLIDTIPLIVASHRHAVQTVLGRDLSDAELRAGIGRPLPEQMRAIDADHAEALYHAFRAFNHANTAEYLAWFDGIDVLLERLAADGVRLAIATSKSRDAVDLAFSLQPPAVALDACITLEDTTMHKPDPAPVLLAFERVGGDVRDAAYVGDAVFDLAAARAAGCAFVAVTWGVGTAEELASADAIAANAGDLYEVLRGGR
jgi:pyrophosphatase PpaX